MGRGALIAMATTEIHDSAALYKQRLEADYQKVMERQAEEAATKEIAPVATEGDFLATEATQLAHITIPDFYRDLPMVAESGINDLPLGIAAEVYAELGVPVFALQPNTKIPYPGTNGVKDATTDKDRIVRFWGNHPTANIGLATGFVFDVVDVDVKSVNGWDTIRRINGTGLLAGAVARVSTPSGGGHLIFPASGGGNHTHAKTGIDYRGLGGYVVGAPSRIEGYETTYTFVETREGNGQPFNWDRFLSVITPKQPMVAAQPTRHTKSTAGLVKCLRNAKEGERNSTLHWAACRFIENGADPNELLQTALETGLTKTEALATIRSAMNGGKR